MTVDSTEGSIGDADTLLGSALHPRVLADSEGRLQREAIAAALFGADDDTDDSTPPDPALAALPKSRRLGHYRILGELGRGGMGVVYVAHDTKLDRKVAIKQLRAAGTSSNRRRLIREALAMAKVSHPNVIPIYEIGERGDSTFIVMEYVEGLTLRGWLAAPRAQAEILTTFKAAARGLIAAHQKGVIHRDFKPDNVMIGADGHVRVMDFGLASLPAEPLERELGAATQERSSLEQLTHTGAVMGTPAYMSPEQMRGRPLDAASDQFSFCVALYEALYGERPFDGSSFDQLHWAVTSGRIRETPRGASVPEWLRALVCRGLAFETKERSESMQALLDALVEGELAEAADEREPPAYVFVAHDSHDKQKVLRLCEGLLDHGVRPWLDMWEQAPGEQALAEAPAVIVCGTGEHGEVLAARIERDPNTVYVARFTDASKLSLGEHLEGVELDPADGRWDEVVHELAALVGVDTERSGWLVHEAARARLPADELSPYRGLEAFREQDARWMFGRGQEVGALLELIAAGTRFLTLIGASGSGKSSLLMAGVCPMLRNGALGDGCDWSIAYLRPGPQPCESLAHAIVNLDASGHAVEDALEVKRLRAELVAADDTLRLVLGRRSRGRVLLVLDQLEELFTEAQLASADEAREALAFVRNLLEATEQLAGLDSRLWIAATLRADFVQRALESPELARVLQSGTYFALPPMSEGQIRATIERPAARVGYRVERTLVDKLVAGAANQAGRLPLLQHVLRELWGRRDVQRRVLSHASYAGTGGLEGAIAVAAERTLASLRARLGDPVVLTTRRLMSRLVRLGDHHTGDTRRRAQLAELSGDRITQQVLEAFVRDARVLVAIDVDGVEAVEIAHEALLREWTTLVAWLDADREALRLRQELARDASQLASTSTDAYLWARGRVEEAQRVLAASTVELNSVERGFLEASARAIRRRRRWIRGSIAMSLAAAAAVIVIVSQKNAALEQKDAELRDELNTQKGLRASMLARSPGNELKALHTALDSVDLVEGKPQVLTGPIFTGLVNAVMSVDAGLGLHGHEGKVVAVAYSPDGASIATAGLDETVRLWNAGTGEFVHTIVGHEGAVLAVAFSQDGSRLATASADATARIWDVTSGRELVKLEHDDWVYGVTFSVDGVHVATAGKDHLVRIWDVQGGEELLSVAHAGPVRAVAWSPDNHRVASASEDGTARVWAVSNGAAISTFSGHGGHKLHALAWSSNGTHVATGGEDGAARMWDARTGEQLGVFDHGASVRALAFDATGAYLATGTFDDDAAHLWDVSATGQLRSFRHAGPVVGVAWSPTGTALATASWDGSAKSWTLASSEAMRVLEGHRQGVLCVATSKDGSRMATGSGDDTARLWDAKTGAVVAELRGHTQDVSAVNFSDDGTLLATTSWDGTARLWDGKAGDFIKTLRGHEGRVHGVAFSPDGSRVVTAGADETARIWHVATGKVTSTLVHDAGVLDVLYSPDGTQILTRTTETSGHSWSSATGKELPFAHQGPVTAMAFASDGRHVALATAGNEVRLWDQASQTVVETWSGHTAAITSLDLSSDGQYLATASEDGTARLWSIGSHGELASLVHDRPVLDVAFWPDASRLATASGDGVARIWARDLMPWLAWGCALAESRSDAVTTWDACATSSRDRVRVAGVLTEPPIIDGDPPRRELIVEHGVEFLLIPGGTFKMGSPPGVGENHEHPQHEVGIDDFYLARTELTNAQYLLFLRDNPQIAEPKLWHEDAYNQPDQPVVGLTWYEATAYCEWAGFVLPTEAQWEYAARANTETVYWFGDDANEFDRFGWHLDNAGGRAHSVATIGANAFGLYDMTGNVFEWVLDNYETYEVVPRPGDGLRRAPAGEGVIRGGAWYHSPRFHRSAEREMTSFDRSGYNQLGFRPAIQPADRPLTDPARPHEP